MKPVRANVVTIPPGAVLQLVGREQKADVAYDRDQEAGMRAVHVQERSQCGECQSHSSSM